MLSGTSTQSPVSSVLNLPTVSMPQGSLATSATSLVGGGGGGGLPENLFLGMPGVTANDVDSKDLAGKRKGMMGSTAQKCHYAPGNHHASHF